MILKPRLGTLKIRKFGIFYIHSASHRVVSFVKGVSDLILEIVDRKQINFFSV